MIDTLDIIPGSCIIQIVGDQVVARYDSKSGRQRRSLVAYINGSLVEWRTTHSISTIGTLERVGEELFLKIPVVR